MYSSKKQEVISDLQNKFQEMNLVIVVNYTGLTVDSATELRGEMYKEGAEFKVVKNTLAKIACKGSQYESLYDLFVGPTALAFSKDSVAAAKAIFEFSQSNPSITIVAGALNNKKLEIEDVKYLAKLPSLDDVRSKILLAINSPSSRIARIVKEPGAKIARVLNAYSTRE